MDDCLLHNISFMVVCSFVKQMTPKEAFRKLSHKFHGKGPGKMKQEKRQKQFQEELKLKQMNAGDTPLMAMEKIRDAQAQLRAPYLVISGHIKPGQTSDPRSGFATVEKEPVGSLTPMLGDNKTIGSLTPMLGDKKVITCCFQFVIVFVKKYQSQVLYLNFILFCCVLLYAFASSFFDDSNISMFLHSVQ